MIQKCEAIVRIFNTKNPSTIRDYLNIYFKQTQHQILYGELINNVDVWRDNDDVLIKININIHCNYIPGCKGSYWEPGEASYIEGYLEIDDFINLVDKALAKNFADKDYSLEEDEDSYIPTEEQLLEDKECEYRYEEY